MMTWAEFTAARQLLLEEKVGTRQRAVVLAEDAKDAASTKALRDRDEPTGKVHGSD